MLARFRPLPLQPFTPFSDAVLLNHLLKTNEPPHDSEISFLRNLIAQGHSRMAELDARVELMHRSVHRLLQTKDKLHSLITKHEAAISLVRQIPLEILAYIFEFVVESNEYYPPWTLSAVCGRWRAAALSQPRLWTSIRYHRYNPFDKYEAQLLRSGTLPLSIEVDVDMEHPNDLSPEERCIFQLLCDHASRWENVSLRGPRQLFMEEIRWMITAPLSRLRQLAVEMPYDSFDPNPMDVFQSALQLERVQANREFWYRPLPMTLSWSQLVTFGGSNTWAGHLHALATASNLVDCAPDIVLMPDSPLPPAPILLPRLQRLSFSNSGFLSCLETPALLELYCANDLHAVPSFVRRHGGKLQKLLMSGESIERRDLTAIVEAVPDVTSLVLWLPLSVDLHRDLVSAAANRLPHMAHFSTY
ncbi:F-box domain-containing protein [Favolaschia claudopus]|uniref:F-box domain-containing protein n=1 Tax=Favolaschia claudopus TaxID=2862362 RepID=A0AAW0BI21_9AGAR